MIAATAAGAAPASPVQNLRSAIALEKRQIDQEKAALEDLKRQLNTTNKGLEKWNVHMTGAGIVTLLGVGSTGLGVAGLGFDALTSLGEALDHGRVPETTSFSKTCLKLGAIGIALVGAGVTYQCIVARDHDFTVNKKKAEALGIAIGDREKNIELRQQKIKEIEARIAEREREDNMRNLEQGDFSAYPEH